MAIRIARNDAGNCINFFGSSNPTYWNAVLEGQVNEDNPNNVDVINTVRTLEQADTVYEFFNLPYTDFVDKDENAFENASECAQYITDNANVLTNQGTFVFSQTDTLDAQREATNTTVLFSNGDIFAVNALHASAASNGTITVSTIEGGKDIYQNLRYYNLTVNDGVLSFNTLAAAVDRLNEVLLGQTITTDPGSLTQNPNTSSATGSWTIYGDRITQSGPIYSSTREVGNFDTSNGMYSNELISTPGSYFEWSQVGNFDNAGTGFTVGLFDETIYEVSELEVDELGNAVKNVIRLRLKNTPFIFSDPASTYGKINETGFNNDPASKLTYRMGLDIDNRAYISYIDPTTNDEVIIGRTETPLAADTELRLNVIMPLENELNNIGNFTVNTAIVAIPLTYYFIESPDGSFDYPLFDSQAQAESADELYGEAAGTGSAIHLQYIDETPNVRNWYMPANEQYRGQSSAPSSAVGTTFEGVIWNEITTGPDTDYVPSQFSQTDLTVDEFDAINLQVKPAGDTASYSVTGLPTGLAFDGFNIIGNAPEVLQDNVANPSDTYTVSVTKANIYGSSVGTFDIIVLNQTQPISPVTGFTWDSGSTPLVDTDTMAGGSVVAIDDTVADQKRFVIEQQYIETNILPTLAVSGEVYIGVADGAAVWSTIEDADWDFYISWRNVSGTDQYINLYNGQDNLINLVNNLTDAYYDYAIEIDGTDVHLIACNVGDIMSQPSVNNGGVFSQVKTISNYTATKPLTLHIASVGTQTELPNPISGIETIDIPTAPTTMTNWTKALDFSGSSERAQKTTNGGAFSHPLMMSGSTSVHSSWVVNGNTHSAGNSRPWAVAIVFQADGNSSNQHIWNQGEGAGSTDDNIYLRIDANRRLYFGWGRSGSLNEFLIHPANTGTGWQLSTGNWYGIYIAHNGVRLSGTNATPANLADMFDIRLMGSSQNWATVDGSDTNLMNTTDWVSTGGRMDRTYLGEFTIGGRGSNRNFHGKVASCVVRTLKLNTAMPNTAEIEMMITDPLKWQQDYMVGNTYRPANQGTNYTNYQIGQGQAVYAVQMWLMGDGTNDSYSNMIRNQADPNDQNYSKLDMVSMVASDIETVSIPGLS